MPIFPIFTTEQIKKQTKKIGQTYLLGQKQGLKGLLKEIETEDYQTIGEVVVSINLSIEILTELEKGEE